MRGAAVRNLLGRRPPDKMLATMPGLEGSYRHVFLRELEQLGEVDDYFAIGGAANYSLLYLILRIGAELRPQSVLDVGCGESTRLWSRLRARGMARRVLTLEDDPHWAARLSAMVDHPIRVSALRSMMIAGGRIDTYNWGEAMTAGPFDVIGVDGPFGQGRRSRAGVLSLLDETLPADFVLFMDDAERTGEQETVGLIHHRLTAMGRSYAAGVLRAAKTQVVFAGGAYRRAAYF